MEQYLLETKVEFYTLLVVVPPVISNAFRKTAHFSNWSANNFIMVVNEKMF